MELSSAKFDALSKEGVSLGVERRPTIVKDAHSEGAIVADPGTGSSSSESGRNLRGRTATLRSFSHLRDPKATIGVAPDSGCFQSEPLPGNPILQNDESSFVKLPDADPMLDGVLGSQGRLPACPNEAESSQVPGANLLESSIFLQSSSLRPSPSPVVILDSNESCTRASQGRRHSSTGLHRRSSILASGQGSSNLTPEQSGLVPREAGNDHKLEKVKTFSCILADMGGHLLGISAKHLVPPDEAARGDSGPGTAARSSTQSIKKVLGKTSRPRSLCGSGKQKSKASPPRPVKTWSFRPRDGKRPSYCTSKTVKAGTTSMDQY